MNPRRTLLVALAALALVTSAAALSSPSLAQDDDSGTSYDASSHDSGNQTGDSGSASGNDTDGSGGNQTAEGNETSGEDGSASSHQENRSRDGSDGDRDPDDDRDRDSRPERAGPERRDVRVEVDDDRAEFRSEARDGEVRSELRLELRGGDASLRLDFENRTDDGRVELEMETSHAVLQEFRDVDGDGAIDPDEPVVQRVDLRDRDPTLTVNETPVGPRVTARYALPGGGSFAAQVLLPSGPAQVGTQRVSPDEAKIDYRIEDFPYQANDTRLALQVQVEAASEARGGADTSGVTLQGEGAAGYYRWVPNATVDGAVREVVPRVDALQSTTEDGETETEHVIHLAYARGETVVHDPTFGVESVEEAVRQVMGHLPAYVVAAGATAALAGGIAYARTRSPRPPR